MTRHARKQSKSGIHHIMLRGINRQDLFHDGDDLHKMITVLSECTEISGVRLHSYCLMVNHVHLLAQTGGDFDSETLPQYMKRIAIRYAMYYNNKDNRVGSLYNDALSCITAVIGSTYRRISRLTGLSIGLICAASGM